MNAPTNLPAERKPRTEIDVLKAQVSKKADEFAMVLPSHISIDKFQRIVATAALSNPQLLQCDRQSFLLAANKLAQDGLLPDGREAALVPFKSWNKDTKQTVWQVQAMPMVYGLRKKILQSGEVISIETGVVYRAELQSGHFIYEIGMDPPIRHRPNFSLTEDEMQDTEIVGAYSIARLKNDGGDPYWSVEVMRRVEIDKVRQTSQTGAVGRVVKGGPNKGKPIPPSGPWVDWFSEMARKTVLRRHSKVLPMSSDLIDTFDRDIEQERAADSAASFLSVEPDEPVSLPAHDPETGEVVDHEPARDERGMTEVSEEEARALDAGEDPNDGTLSDDNPTAEEGPAQEQRGEPEDQAEAAAQTLKDIDGPLEAEEPTMAEKAIKAAVDGARGATSLAQLKKIETTWLNARAAVDEDQAKGVDSLIDAARRELRAKADKAGGD